MGLVADVVAEGRRAEDSARGRHSSRQAASAHSTATKKVPVPREKSTGCDVGLAFDSAKATSTKGGMASMDDCTRLANQ